MDEDRTPARILSPLERVAVQVVVGALLFEAFLVGLHLWAADAPPGRFPPEFVGFASLEYETGLGTWFSALQFSLLATLLAALSWKAGRSQPWGSDAVMWGLFAAGALFLSADEAASIHEQVGGLFADQAAQAPAGTLLFWLGRHYHSYYWALVYVPLAVPAALVVVTFLWRRLGPYRHLPWVAVALFFFAAVGLDALEGWIGDEKHGPVALGSTGLRLDLVLVEETLEMVAVTLVLAACAGYAARVFGEGEEARGEAEGD